jgi:hypothetical protein
MGLFKSGHMAPHHGAFYPVQYKLDNQETITKEDSDTPFLAEATVKSYERKPPLNIPTETAESDLGSLSEIYPHHSASNFGLESFSDSAQVVRSTKRFI